MVLTAMLAQVDARAVESLQRIATAQMIMAAVMILIGLLALGAAVIVLIELRSARRLVRGMLDTVEDLKPRVAPLIDRAREVTDEVAGMTDDVRRKLDDLLYTAESLNRSVQRGSEAAEERLRRFSAVLDIVQTETEDLLLDAAAAAHGMQETARVLRQPRTTAVVTGEEPHTMNEEEAT
jgi:uncharacterized protein YoxC